MEIFLAKNQFHIQQRYPANVVNNYKIILWEEVNDHRLFPFYHNNVASGDEITPCNKIDKPLVVYRFSGNVMTSITMLHR